MCMSLLTSRFRFLSGCDTPRLRRQSPSLSLPKVKKNPMSLRLTSNKHNRENNAKDRQQCRIPIRRLRGVGYIPWVCACEYVRSRCVCVTYIALGKAFLNTLISSHPYIWYRYWQPNRWSPWISPSMYAVWTRVCYRVTDVEIYTEIDHIPRALSADVTWRYIVYDLINGSCSDLNTIYKCFVFRRVL